jgi:hypothetical protein
LQTKLDSVYIPTATMDIEKTHLKALLADPHMRQVISNRLDDEELVSADFDDLPDSEFAALHDAAWEALDRAPLVKSYLAKGADGDDYPIDIVGVNGAYSVRAPELDDKGMFETLEEAEDYIGLNWFGEAREV